MVSKTKEKRVGALLSCDNKKALLLGYGVFEGCFIPDENAGGVAELCRASGETNPRIRLDNGKTVWGCECWWGPEEEIKNKIRNLEVINIDIDEFRKKAKKYEGQLSNEIIEESVMK